MTARPTQSKAARCAIIIILIICSVLGYGYWHAATHASFHIDMQLKAKPGSKPQAMPDAEITFHDESGGMLARGVSDGKANFVRLLHPDVGDCHEAEKTATSSEEGRTAWQECFAHLSTWIPTWAKDVRQADITYNGV